MRAAEFALLPEASVHSNSALLLGQSAVPVFVPLAPSAATRAVASALHQMAHAPSRSVRRPNRDARLTREGSGDESGGRGGG